MKRTKVRPAIDRSCDLLLERCHCVRHGSTERSALCSATRLQFRQDGIGRCRSEENKTEVCTLSQLTFWQEAGVTYRSAKPDKWTVGLCPPYRKPRVLKSSTDGLCRGPDSPYPDMKTFGRSSATMVAWMPTSTRTGGICGLTSRLERAFPLRENK